MSQPKLNLSPRVRAALEATGLPWEIEPARSSNHSKVRLAGAMVGIVPCKGGAEFGRAEKNLISQIKRAREAANV